MLFTPLLLMGAVIGYQDWQLRGSTPGNPGSGYLRMWADSTAGKFKCITSAGASCYFDTNTSSGVSSFSGDGTLISNSSSTGAVTTTLANAAAHKFWGNNTGSSAAPGYQSITTSDLPNTVTQTIASGTASLGTSAISSASCATVVTVTATGVASTDAITITPNASIKAVTGYTPSTSGGLTVAAYPTANNVNFDVCNWTSSSITPGAVVLNWRVVR